MKTMRQLQLEQAEWAAHNFGDRPSWEPALGLIEEVGELAHAVLKRSQEIRGTREEHDAAIKDAIGDAAIYLLDYSTRRGIELADDDWSEWGYPEPELHKVVGELAHKAGELMDACGCGTDDNGDVDAFACWLHTAAIAEGYSLATAVEETWDRVRLRDWKANPADGAQP